MAIVRKQSTPLVKVAEKPKPKVKAKKPKYKPVKNFTRRQIDFALRYYLPTSPTYGNALQSAIAAGYSPKYAKSITTMGLEWMEKILLEIIGKPEDKRNLVLKARKVLSKSLESDDEKIRQDTAKFLAKTDEEFSEKKDITTGGEKLEVPVALVEFVDGENTSADSN